METESQSNIKYAKRAGGHIPLARFLCETQGFSDIKKTAALTRMSSTAIF
jgi:hypothetical protein